MRETGFITEINGDKARVQLDFKGGCKGCSMNGVCKADGTGKRQLELSTGNISLQIGDNVEIETSPRSLLTAAFLIFILPLIFSFGAYFLVFHFTASRGLGLLGFFASFGLALLLVSIIDKTAGNGKYFQPVIIKKVSL